MLVSEMVSDLLTVNEAAALLRLKPSTIRAWILHRKIPHIKLGGRVFLRKHDCDALIVSCVVPAHEVTNGTRTGS
jgi:excisionase family DNA binding protein